MKLSKLKEKIKKDIGKAVEVKKLKKIINNITPKEFKKQNYKNGKENSLYTLILKKLRRS